MVLQSLQGLPAFIAYFCLATVKDATASECHSVVTTGGAPNYVELLTSQTTRGMN
jgi:hypothetical protein